MTSVCCPSCKIPPRHGTIVGLVSHPRNRPQQPWLNRQPHQLSAIRENANTTTIVIQQTTIAKEKTGRTPPTMRQWHLAQTQRSSSQQCSGNFLGANSNNNNWNNNYGATSRPCRQNSQYMPYYPPIPQGIPALHDPSLLLRQIQAVARRKSVGAHNAHWQK
jgi:hypothetical protein